MCFYFGAFFLFCLYILILSFPLSSDTFLCYAIYIENEARLKYLISIDLLLLPLWKMSKFPRNILHMLFCAHSRPSPTFRCQAIHIHTPHLCSPSPTLPLPPLSAPFSASIFAVFDLNLAFSLPLSAENYCSQSKSLQFRLNHSFLLIRTRC